MSFILSGIFSIIGMIGGRIFSYLDRALELKYQERQALMQKAGLEVKDRARAQNVPINFTRRVVMISFTLLFAGVIAYSFVNPAATIVIPTLESKLSIWKMIFSMGEGSKVIFIELPLTLIAVPFIELYSLMVGFYFGSGGSVQKWR